MLGVTVKAVAFAVAHAKFTNSPGAARAGETLKLDTIGSGGGGGGGGGFTVTAASAVLEVSAAATAVTVTCKGCWGEGAVYRPLVEIVPDWVFPPVTPFTCHVTAVLVDPVTVAWNCWVAPAARVTEVGEIVIATGGGGGGPLPLSPPPPVSPPPELLALPPHPTAINTEKMARKHKTTRNRNIGMGPIHHLANIERRLNLLTNYHGVDLDCLLDEGNCFPMIQKLTSELRWALAE